MPRSKGGGRNGFSLIELLIVLCVFGIVAGIGFIATTGGDSTLVHNTDVSPERGQPSIRDKAFMSAEEMSHRLEGPAHWIIPEEGMYQEVRIDVVCVPGRQLADRLLAVARTPGSVTPVSITEIGVC